MTNLHAYRSGGERNICRNGKRSGETIKRNMQNQNSELSVPFKCALNCSEILRPTLYLHYLWIMLPILAVLSTQIVFFHLAPSIFATPLQPGLPTLFNSALLNASTLQTINTALPDNEHPCFHPGSDRLPTNYLDCTSASLEILKGGRDTRLYTFGRGGRATYKLPKTFFSGTCVINLDMVYDEQTDKMTLLEVQQAALGLALRCTTSTVYKMGGVAAVGPRNVLYVTIIGVAARDTS